MERKRKKTRGFTKDDRAAYLCLVPITILVVIFMMLPAVQNIAASLAGSDGHFDRFEGFQTFFRQKRFLVNVKNTLIYAGCSVALTIPAGMLGAHLITDESRFVKILRPIYMIPWIIPYVCSGIMFRTMFHGQGLFTGLLKEITGKQIMFLSDPVWSMVVVVFHQFWRSLPFAMLFIAAGLTTIPNGLYEAATMDGAGKWKQFTNVTFPLIKSHVFLVTLMVTNGTMQDSEAIYTINFGGPGNATETVAVRLYKDAFKSFNIDVAPILSTILLAIAMAVIVVYSRVMKQSEENIYE